MKKFEDMTKDELIQLVNKTKEQKKYGLVWEDKPEDVVDQCKRELPVLEEVSDKAIVMDSTKPTNLLIEGDNYHALSVLNYTHNKAIDVIYIDPPYNRGNKDFKYNDRYVDVEDTYRHSKWLSFMEKRLVLAKKLLSEKGVIFISIDDVELGNLRLLCDSIFGEKNVEVYIWDVKDESEGALPKTAKYTVRKEHEYIVACFIKKTKIKFNKYREYSYISKSDWGNPDNDPRGDWMSGNISRGTSGKPGSNYYEIVTPTGKCYTRNWSISFEDYIKLREDNRIHFAKKGNGVPRIKIFQNEEQLVTQSSIIRNVRSSITGTKTIVDLLGKCDFEHPKPVELIERLITISSYKDSIILDFFAGTGTTGHAVLRINDIEKSNRSFILCTNNEQKISEEICYPRIKKVIQNLSDDVNKGKTTNLRYFRTSFVLKSKISDDVRQDLVKKSTEMICIKEGTFIKLIDNSDCKIFKNHNQLTGILFNLDSLEDFKEKINFHNLESSIYVFSLTNDSFEEDFQDLTVNHKLCPIPESILEVYRKLFKE